MRNVPGGARRWAAGTEDTVREGENWGSGREEPWGLPELRRGPGGRQRRLPEPRLTPYSLGEGGRDSNCGTKGRSLRSLLTAPTWPTGADTRRPPGDAL